MILLLLAQATGLGATDYEVGAPMAAPRAAPSFSDEFDGRTADDARWRFDASRNATGWFNHERRYHAPANARAIHGKPVIEARHETPHARDSGGQGYTSARLVSRAALGFGFYEVRAMPYGCGIWPAIWLLTADGRWPDQGEIDVMEMVGWDPNVVHATLHTGLSNHVRGTQRGADKRIATSCTAFPPLPTGLERARDRDRSGRPRVPATARQRT